MQGMSFAAFGESGVQSPRAKNGSLRSVKNATDRGCVVSLPWHWSITDVHWSIGGC